ncbi:hypothetical protein GCM10019016_047060 [Streptomyces prasinosporus]|uniref:Aminopeptidase N-like N-terminal domain-containing protein n=1 Tax=Streptomyces prasinosporus TaxID=68256 RepID=A0ABP6TSC9_9ACTN
MPLTSRHPAPLTSRHPAPRTPRRPAHRARHRTAQALLASAVGVCLVAASAPAEPLGIGDPLFPHLGNPGYDVQAYDLDLTYPGSNDQPLDAVTTIDARITAELDRINLDFAHGTVRSVEVDGEPAVFTGAGEDLVITPDDDLDPGEPVRITVRHTSDPRPGDREGGWVRTADGLALANQADAAHLVFPCNDHPSDKAMFTFRITVPEGYTAVANGLPTAVDRAPATTTWRYRTRNPMATELAQVSVGRSTVLHRTGPHGLPLRDVVPTEHRAALEPWLAKTPAQIAWMEDRVGRYPFATYGLLLAEASTGFALETQTLSLFERDLFTDPALPAWYVESIMVHELAHQWFGDSVSPPHLGRPVAQRGARHLVRGAVRRGARRQVPGDPDADRVRVLRRLAHRGRAARRAEAARAGPQDRHLPPGRLRRRRAGALRPAPGDRAGGVRPAGARLGRPSPRRQRLDRRLRPAGLRDRRPRPHRLPARLAVRRHHPADARSPRLAVLRAGRAGGARPPHPRAPARAPVRPARARAGRGRGITR